MQNLVWYACYGSNLNHRRFMCYISGGSPPGSSHTNPGCKDKSPPIDTKPILLNFDLYFAHYFEGWNGGAAFISSSRDDHSATLGRMYLITDDQFNDVVLQENGQEIENRTRFVPPFNELSKLDSSTLPGNLLYGKLLRVSTEEQYPVLTFTTARDLGIRAPSEKYIQVITSGLKETYPAMRNAEILEYLLSTEGVRGRIQPDILASWIASAL